MSRMVLICRNDVPPYLHDSVFYNLLDPSDEEEFEVPEECFKRDLNFTCLADLRHYLHTFQFWGSRHLDDRACFYMYRNCKLDIIESLQNEFCQIEVFTLVMRMRKSHPEHLISTALECDATLTFVAWLHEAVYTGFSVSDCAAAATMNNLPALKYLHEQGCPWDKQTILNAIALGHMDCLKYAFIYNCPRPGTDICVKHAAFHGQIIVLKYLHYLDYRFCSQILARAVNTANKNSLACVKYLVEAGCPLSANAISSAALNGNLVCLQYLHERGCSWNTEVTISAASSGQLACLIYAHKHGCPWNRCATMAAAKNSYLACLQYAVFNGCPCNINTFNVAVKNYSWRCAYFVATHCLSEEREILYLRGLIAIVVLVFMVIFLYVIRETFLMWDDVKEMLALLKSS